MAFISLGKIDKSFIVIIVGCIFCFLNRLLYQADSLLEEIPILHIIVSSQSRFLTVIPFIILNIRTKRTTNNNNEMEYTIREKKEKKLIFYDNEKRYVKGKWKFILLSGIIYSVNTTFFALSLKVKTNAWILYILIASVFYYLIYKVKLYKHHVLSIVLILLIGIIIDLIKENIQNEIINKTLLVLSKFMKEIAFSLYNVVAKYVMEKKYISVYEFSFYIGLMVIILFTTFAVFDYYFFKIYDYDNYFNNFNTKELLVIFEVIFTQLGINLTTLFTTKNNSPCHVFIIFVFGQLAYYVNFDTFENIHILIIILLIIILFLSLIFNEIIEINIFGLSYNTKRNIVKRAMKEGESRIDDVSEFSEGDLEIDNYFIELKYKEVDE